MTSLCGTMGRDTQAQVIVARGGSTGKATLVRWEMDQAALVNDMIDAKKELMLYGPDDVLRLHFEFLAAEQGGSR